MVVLLVAQLPVAISTDDSGIVVMRLPGKVMQLQAKRVGFAAAKTDGITPTQAAILLF